MSRTRWIWTISWLQLPIFILLIWHGCPYRPTWVAWLKHATGSERTFGINLEEIDMAYLPIPEQIAMGLNFPPALVGQIAVIPAYYASRPHLTSAKMELISHIITAAIIPFFWFWAIGATSVRKRTRSKLSVYTKISIIVTMAILSLLAIVILMSIILGGVYFRGIMVSVKTSPHFKIAGRSL